jgi:hypothetical protein
MKIGNLDRMVAENMEQAEKATKGIEDAGRRDRACDSVFNILMGLEIQFNLQANLQRVASLGIVKP